MEYMVFSVTTYEYGTGKNYQNAYCRRPDSAARWDAKLRKQTGTCSLYLWSAVRRDDDASVDQLCDFLL